MTCQHDDKYFSQDLQDLSQKTNIVNKKFVGSHGINPLLTREVLSTYKEEITSTWKKVLLTLK